MTGAAVPGPSWPEIATAAPAWAWLRARVRADRPGPRRRPGRPRPRGGPALRAALRLPAGRRHPAPADGRPRPGPAHPDPRRSAGRPPGAWSRDRRSRRHSGDLAAPRSAGRRPAAAGPPPRASTPRWSTSCSARSGWTRRLEGCAPAGRAPRRGRRRSRRRGCGSWSRTPYGRHPLRLHLQGPRGSGRHRAAEALAAWVGVPILAVDLRPAPPGTTRRRRTPSRRCSAPRPCTTRCCTWTAWTRSGPTIGSRCAAGWPSGWPSTADSSLLAGHPGLDVVGDAAAGPADRAVRPDRARCGVGAPGPRRWRRTASPVPGRSRRARRALPASAPDGSRRRWRTAVTAARLRVAGTDDARPRTGGSCSPRPAPSRATSSRRWPRKVEPRRGVGRHRPAAPTPWRSCASWATGWATAVRVLEDWGFERALAPRPRGERAVRRAAGHRQDHGRRGHRGRARAGPLHDRPRRGGQQVHRRDGEEPRAGVRRGRRRRRDPAVRRGGRAVRQALRGPGRPRPVRQHRGGLPAAADGGSTTGWRSWRPTCASNLDEAFTRRLQFIVEFPLPDVAERRRHLAGLPPGRAPR